MNKPKRPHFVKRKVVDPVLNFLTIGVTPEKLAWAVAVGATVAVFPVIGSTTLLCAGIALVFRLNMAAIQLVNYFAYPLQFIFFVPFIKMGEWLFNEQGSGLTVGKIFNMFKENLWQAIQALWWTTMHAIVAWGLVAPVAGLIIYFSLVSAFRKIAKNKELKKVLKEIE